MATNCQRLQRGLGGINNLVLKYGTPHRIKANFMFWPSIIKEYHVDPEEGHCS